MAESAITALFNGLYQILDNGKRAKIRIEECELLRQGFNPEQIIAIRPSAKLKVH